MQRLQRRVCGSVLASLILAGLAGTGCGVRLRRGAVSQPLAPAGASDPADTVPRIEVEAAFAEVRGGRAVLVDVRSRTSYRDRHAAGALSLPLDELETATQAAVAALPADRRPILYCT